jgi:hypothetical protein
MDAATIRAIADALEYPRKIDLVDADGNTREMVIAPDRWRQVVPPVLHVMPLTVNTLSGLIAYAKAHAEQMGAALMVHVESPTSVALVGSLAGEADAFRRHTYLKAHVPWDDEARACEYGIYHDAETFIVWLQAGFVPTPSSKSLLELIGSIREKSVRDTVDDGLSQEVSTGRGVHLVGQTKVENPVRLAPYRTFPEVAQPESPFIVRMQSAKDGDRPRIALFEADGGAWRLEAIRGIESHLRAALGDGAVIIA